MVSRRTTTWKNKDVELASSLTSSSSREMRERTTQVSEGLELSNLSVWIPASSRIWPLCHGEFDARVSSLIELPNYGSLTMSAWPLEWVVSDVVAPLPNTSPE